MTTFGKLAEFKPGTEEFSAYLERVDLFFLSNDVAAEKKVPIFLNCIGSTTYSLLWGLVAPEKPADLSLADLTTKLKAHFEPKHIVIAECFQFHKRGQNYGESVAEYLAELRRLAARCAFGNYLEEALRDRLVCGLRRESIQKRLLSKAELTLAKAVDLAQSLEAAPKSAQTLKGTTDLAVGLMEHKKARSPVEGRAYHWCEKNSHLAPQCNFKDATCHTCGKKGHLAHVCRSSRQQKPAKGAWRRANVSQGGLEAGKCDRGGHH